MEIEVHMRLDHYMALISEDKIRYRYIYFDKGPFYNSTCFIFTLKQFVYYCKFVPSLVDVFDLDLSSAIY